MKFDKHWKLYVFKNREEISLSFRITDSYCVTYHMPINEFEILLDTWDQGGFHERGWCVEHKYPGIVGMSYVRFSVKNEHHRMSVESMKALVDEYNHQINNVMYWDDKTN